MRDLNYVCIRQNSVISNDSFDEWEIGIEIEIEMNFISKICSFHFTVFYESNCLFVNSDQMFIFRLLNLCSSFKKHQKTGSTKYANFADQDSFHFAS